jgi:hydrogenase nickel incorporation protein HypB
MCATCGCHGDGAIVHATAREHEHDHEHDHGHDQHLPPGDSRTVVLQQKILAKNDRIAEGNRSWLAQRSVTMINLMSSPGSGKTTLLERTATTLPVQVIEGDQETMLDANRIKAAGGSVVQINTGAGCHLDAQMVATGLARLDPPAGSLVVIENVGNLVCPALFDLGEVKRVVLASVTEGGDKPLKYPHMFRQADLVLVSKIDLLPYVDFDPAAYAADVALIAPGAALMTVSAKTGEGLPAWCDWLVSLSEHAAGEHRLGDHRLGDHRLA